MCVLLTNVMNVTLICHCSSSVTVSVLSIEGTDCRLDELGRLADRTGGTVRCFNISQINVCWYFSFNVLFC